MSLLILMFIKILSLLQVAALAPLALLLVIEAHCAHFVIVHQLILCVVEYMQCITALTQHIYMKTNLSHVT